MTQLSHANDARGRLYWRLFWVAIMLAHAQATWNGIVGLGAGDSSDAGANRLIFLSVSNLFFLLEIIFSPCLKAMSQRRNAITLLLVVTLLHAGVIRRCLSGADNGREPIVVLVTTGSALAGYAIRKALRLGSTQARSIAVFEPTPPVPASLHSFVPHLPPLAGWLRAPLRAPPCLIIA